ncbi:hypothetical protein [Thioalkalivibrio sp. ALE16]|uniref:hypothetical protein n=1 Tax=Thioalkalivibrio sp. ALE16 TaxID=1158172 RepID=UPI000372E38B|nr:hypothetical protein [Thioalkalivibrio sp. ALE16]
MAKHEETRLGWLSRAADRLESKADRMLKESDEIEKKRKAKAKKGTGTSLTGLMLGAAIMGYDEDN